MSQCQEREPGMERGDTYGGIHIGVPHSTSPWSDLGSSSGTRMGKLGGQH